MHDNLRVHASYVIGMLIALNIFTLTFKWGGVQDLVGYLNFGSTLTSLVLAVLAIVYAYLSNASVGQQVATLRAATDDMRGVAAAVTSAAAELQARFDAIPKLFEEVGAKVNQTHEYVHRLYDERESRAAGAPANDQETAGASVGDRFLQLASLEGLRGLYLVASAFEAKVAFNFRDAMQRVKVDYEYAHGFLIACVAAGLAEINTNDDIWNVGALNPEVQAGVKGTLVRRQEEFAKEWGSRFGRSRAVDRIEAYLAGDDLPEDDPAPSSTPHQ